MTKRRTLRALVTAGVAGILAVVAAVPMAPRASALPAGYQMVYGVYQSVPGGQTASIAVNCPTGQVPLGGGMYSPRDDMRSVASYALGAPANPRGWYATVANTGTVSATANVYAVCADPVAVPGYQVVTAAQTVGPGQTANAFVSCGPGKVPMSGGVYAGSNALRIVQSYPLGAPWSWTATVANEGTTTTTFELDSYCVNSGALPGYQLHVLANRTVDPGQVRDNAASCTMGQVAIGGGSNASTTALRTVMSMPADWPEPHAWSTVMANPGPTSAYFHIYAICVTK